VCTQNLGYEFTTYHYFYERRVLRAHPQQDDVAGHSLYRQDEESLQRQAATFWVLVAAQDECLPRFELLASVDRLQRLVVVSDVHAIQLDEVLFLHACAHTYIVGLVRNAEAP